MFTKHSFSPAVSIFKRVMKIEKNAEFLINLLNGEGFECFAVGGCVRDSIMGKPPDDWDLCTSASPQEIKGAFDKAKIACLEYGIKHGTLTAIIDSKAYEITSFRAEGSYSDFRHPDKVVFLKDIDSDLARRDFTVNAMAYSPKTGLIDLFGGQEDIGARIIRCVGNPENRFTEDALRILRALRFCSTLNFTADDKTKRAVLRKKELLQSISRERIHKEFFKLLSGDSAAKILNEYRCVFSVLLPEIDAVCAVKGAWEKMIKTIDYLPPKPEIRLCALARSIKQAAGENALASAISSLRLSRRQTQLIESVARFLPFAPEADEKNILKQLRLTGKEVFSVLLEIYKAESLAADPPDKNALHTAQKAQEIFTDITAKGKPYTINSLKVDGNDIKSLGFYGEQIGQCLENLLDHVIDGTLDNEKSVLIKYIKNKK